MTSNANDFLLAVDLQRDFCEGGALAVPGGSGIVPAVNLLMERFRRVVLTRDWHPRGHVSFASSHPGRRPFDRVTLPYGSQVLWPDHCVQGTEGARFHPGLAAGRAELVVMKGMNPDVDSYSAFLENDRRTATGLDAFLAAAGARRLVLCGLAEDFCVRFSALDARLLGYEVVVVTDACRAIDRQGSGDAARREMAEAGVVFATAAAALESRT